MPRKVLSRRAATASSTDETEVQETAPSTADAPAPSRMNPFAAAVIILVILVAGGLAVKNSLAARTPKTDTKVENTGGNIPADNDVQGIVARVARHIKIKQDEVPTVATVQDAEMLRKNNPSFYQYANNGDRLLIWSDKAILYAPSEDILLAVMPVSINQAAAPTDAAKDQSTSEKETAKVEVRNASGVAGLGKNLANQLKSVGLDVLAPGDAKSKAGYSSSIIYVKPGASLPGTIKAIQQQINASIVESLPQDEPAIKGDILVIIGAEFKK